MEHDVWDVIEGIVGGIQEKVDIDVLGSWEWDSVWKDVGGWQITFCADSPRGLLIGGYVIITPLLLDQASPALFETVGRQFGTNMERIILNELGC